MEWKRGDGRTAKLLSGHLDFSSPLSRQNNARFQLHRELTRFFQSSSRIKPTVHCPRHDSFVSTACYLLYAVAVKWCFSISSHLPCSSNLPFQFVSIRFERTNFFGRLRIWSFVHLHENGVDFGFDFPFRFWTEDIFLIGFGSLILQSFVHSTRWIFEIHNDLFFSSYRSFLDSL